MKIDYFKTNGDSIKVLFPKFLTRQTFETILNQVYPKTLSKSKYSKIIFSFQSLEWADIFELSLISLWIYKILLAKKEIQILYPLNSVTYSFLQRFNFISFLEKISNKENSEVITAPRTRNNTVFYPLSFLTNREFNDLLDDLNYKDRLQLVFNEISDFEIVKTGKLRDIIFAELGENMFLHGEGKNASLSAIAYKTTTPEIAQSRINLVSSFEKNFFRILGNRPYIEIIISDNGKGIYRKLINTYRKDKKYPKHKESPTHADLLEYAFLPYTSSRDLKERLNFIEKALTDNYVNDPPVTGLNKLKLVIKEFRGLILVKSGKGIICYDYLSNGELVFPETNNDKKHRVFKNLVSFNGVQYKILIPLHKPKSITPIQTQFKFNEIQEQIKYEYKRLDAFFTPDCKYKLEIARKQYLLFEQEIEHFHITNNAKNLILIFDFCESGIVNQKMLHLILIKLIESQTTTQLNSFINLPSEYIELFESNYEYKKPIVGFDKQHSRIILGVSQTDKTFFKTIISKSHADQTNINYFVNKYPFLFDNNSNSFIHNRAQILSFANTSIREIIRSNILNQDAKVFHENAKVLIPTNLYCKGYFEIGNLFDNTRNRALIKQWLSLGFNSLKPTQIISLSKHCGEIISEVEIDYKHKLDSIVLENPIKEIDFLQLQFKIKKNSRIIVFTDVISSAKTVSRLLNSLSSFNIIHIVTVVNATNNNSFINQGKKIPLSQALQHSIAYHETLPLDWLYSELLLTDPETNFLIAQNEFRPMGSLLKRYTIKRKIIDEHEVLVNDFLEKIVVPYNLFESGHFITNNKHFSYLFNIRSLVEKFESLLVDSIISHYQADSKKRKIKPELENFILYFTYNPGVYQLCNSLSKKLPRSQIIDIDLSKRKTPIIKGFQNENVFILDDAFISGESIINLIDYCESRGAKNIFVYILIKRGTILSARKLENIKKYGHSNVSVRYLFDSEMPNYNSHDCPICKGEQSIDKMENYIGSEHQLFWSYIRKNHGHKNKRTITAEFSFLNINNNSRSILIRWKIETSKYELVSQKEIIRYLSNYSKYFVIVKSLYSTYSLEKEYLLTEDLYSNDIFWIELKENLLSTGLSILKTDSISETDLTNNILDVIFWLDIEKVSNNFLSIISKAFTSKQRIFELLYIIDRNKDKCVSNLNSFASLINNCLESNNSLDEEVRMTIEKFTDLWLSQFEESIINSNSQIEAIRKLYFESYHEFPRTFDALKASLNSTNTEKTEIISHWWNIKDIIQKSIRNLKLLLKTGLSRNQIELLYNRINELNNLTYKVENLIDSKLIPKNFLLIDKISDTIVGNNGIQFLLKSYRVDLKKSINYLNTIKYSKRFSDAGLTILSDIPEHPCLVFGEITNILSSIDNLYENALKHSGASKFIINISKSVDGHFIEIDIYDNGGTAKIEKGIGLSNVNRNIKRYLGEFSITNDFEDIEFKTNANIKLINLSK